MKHSIKICGVGVLLLAVAFGSEALTLGRARGAVLVGHPLDVVVPVQMDAGENAASLCFEADVFHADARQDASRVRVVAEATTDPLMINLRVLSSVLVDEPVVTVYLRTGCGQKTTRRYVLLADLPSEQAAAVPFVVSKNTAASVPSTASTPASAPAKVVVTPAVVPSAAKVRPIRTAKQTAAAVVDTKRVEAATPVPAKKAVVDDKSKAVRPAGQSRLKLDALDLFSDRVANLDSFMTFEPSEDALRNSQKVQTLEADVKALRAVAAKNEASLLDLRTRLQMAEEQALRFPAWLMYGLAALLLAGLAAVAAFFWSRKRRAQAGDGDWWHGSALAPTTRGAEVNSILPSDPSEPPKPSAARAKSNVAPAPQASSAGPLSGFFFDSKPSAAVDVNLGEMSDSEYGNFMPSQAARKAADEAPTQLSPAIGLQSRPAQTLNSEAVLDIRQQAEFFMSLGQTDLAVRLLKTQIKESDAPNPFVYLDLLSIYHSLSLKSEFQQLRQEFGRLFNTSVPEFVFFKEEGMDLMSYPDVLLHISTLWPTPEVLSLMASEIFSDPHDVKQAPFDLAAFRDLLLLHSIAQSLSLAPPSEDGRPSGIGQATRVAPSLSLTDARPSQMMDLDLNLDTGLSSTAD